ncbi:MAG: hypothetical protein ABIS50_00010 [Luteolibacter sp.]|uniref:hypothetical protein n=1 Tax=Luteolibacter sp. TaxID=1962973 RepID=UPI003264C442
MKTILLLTPLLFASAVQAADPVVKLAGIQAIFDDGSKQFDGFKTYNSEKGCGVVLMIHGGGKQMVGIDGDKATLKIGGTAAKCRFFGGDSAFSKDHLFARLEFEAAGSTQMSPDGTLKVTGEIPVTFATGKAETRSEPLAVAAGAAVKFPAAKAGELPELKVKSSGKPKFGDGAFEIVLSSNRKAEEFAGVRFYAQDGTAVESNQTSSSWMGFAGKGSGEITYSFKAAQTNVIVAVETWTGREDAKVKVDLAAGLASPKP